MSVDLPAPPPVRASDNHSDAFLEVVQVRALAQESPAQAVVVAGGILGAVTLVLALIGLTAL
ncbi:hypothetical protein ACFSBZ_10820 [Amnibacterium flavum]|uniref:Uncharacterized protein n=1 Tax=Amnibacterium flavum TaxID=2173173 RepID=A0A2V1HRT0_9MICO|nr:hypothetical protein [Amnibacterium flavum]PVZ95326.1 hypothetical protein DDQ50_02045 [Amnibacterium flavum]